MALRIEALRLTGSCLLHLGRENDAMLAWKEAVEIGAEVDAAERFASNFGEVANALIGLLERRGFASTGAARAGRSSSPGATPIRVAKREK